MDALEQSVVDRITADAPSINLNPRLRSASWALVPTTTAWAPMDGPKYLHPRDWDDCWRVYTVRGKRTVVAPRPDSYEGQKHIKRMRRLRRII